MTNFEFMRTRILRDVDDSPVGGKGESLGSLRETEWSPAFEGLMRSRLVMGRFRYGLMARDQDIDYDRIGSALERLLAYRASGNQENLVDVANLCLLEFEHGEHESLHFAAVDDGVHVGRLRP